MQIQRTMKRLGQVITGSLQVHVTLKFSIQPPASDHVASIMGSSNGGEEGGKVRLVRICLFVTVYFLLLFSMGQGMTPKSVNM